MSSSVYPFFLFAQINSRQAAVFAISFKIFLFPRNLLQKSRILLEYDAFSVCVKYIEMGNLRVPTLIFTNLLKN